MANPFREDITLWAVTGKDGYGEDTFDAPVKLAGRWEQRAEQFLLPNGEISLSRAVVFLPSSNKDDVHIGDYIYLGWSAETNPTSLDTAWPIRQKLITPDLRRVKNEVRLLI